jgi:hypothetical protein
MQASSWLGEPGRAESIRDVEAIDSRPEVEDEHAPISPRHVAMVARLMSGEAEVFRKGYVLRLCVKDSDKGRKRRRRRRTSDEGRYQLGPAARDIAELPSQAGVVQHRRPEPGDRA